MENDLTNGLALKFSQQIPTEKRNFNFKLKGDLTANGDAGDLVRKIYIWAGYLGGCIIYMNWEMFCIIYLQGDFSTDPIFRSVDFSFYYVYDIFRQNSNSSDHQIFLVILLLVFDSKYIFI